MLRLSVRPPEAHTVRRRTFSVLLHGTAAHLSLAHPKISQAGPSKVLGKSFGISCFFGESCSVLGATLLR